MELTNYYYLIAPLVALVDLSFLADLPGDEFSLSRAFYEPDNYPKLYFCLSLSLYGLKH